MALNTVIVVATHGGVDLLKQSLPRMAKWPVVVVDTGASSAAVADLCSKFDNVAYIHTPYNGYDTGAYLWAYWNVPAKNYLFMQDSCCPRDEDFVEQFQNAMPCGGASQFGVVGWSSFTMSCWDSDAQRSVTEWLYGRKEEGWPSLGIFGPIFYTTRTVLDHLRMSGNLPMPPVHKQQQQAMERAWAILFHKAHVEVRFLRLEEMPDGAAMTRGEYPALNKVFRMRT